MTESERTITAGELRALDPFGALSESELTGLAGSASRRSLGDGSALFEAGQPAGELFVVERGQVALRAADAGRSTIVMTADAGALLGWSALRPGARWMTTGRAVGAVTAVALPAEAVFAVLTSGSPGAAQLAARLFEIAAAHLHETQTQLLRSGREGTITGG